MEAATSTSPTIDCLGNKPWWRGVSPVGAKQARDAWKERRVNHTHSSEFRDQSLSHHRLQSGRLMVLCAVSLPTSAAPLGGHDGFGSAPSRLGQPRQIHVSTLTRTTSSSAPSAQRPSAMAAKGGGGGKRKGQPAGPMKSGGGGGGGIKKKRTTAGGGSSRPAGSFGATSDASRATRGGKKKINLGSKARRAARAMRDAAPSEGGLLVPGGADGVSRGQRRTRGGEEDGDGVAAELEAVDWTQVSGWSKIKYDPNRLIYGAQEEGFIELEEIDMEEVARMTGGAPMDGAGPSAGKAKKRRNGEEEEEDDDDDFADFADFEDEMDHDDPYASGTKPLGKRTKAEKAPAAKKDAASAKVKATRTTSLAEAAAAAAQAAAAVDNLDTSGMSVKEARIAKRKAKWKAKVEAAKLRKLEARAAGVSTPPNNQEERRAGKKAVTPAKDEEEEYDDEDNEDEDEEDVDEYKRAAAEEEAAAAAAGSAATAAATGAAAAEGWQMDYNNYPTSGMGAVVDGIDLDRGADISNWLEFDLHPKLLRALQDLGFTQPTPVQQECLNPAVKGRCDIIGAAETGSGKTLAFALPILHRLLTQQDEEADEGSSESESEEEEDEEKTQEEKEDEEDDPFANVEDESGRKGSRAGMTLSRRRKALRALIIAPTRELAMQVCDMIKSVARHTTISVVPVVGGMSLQKQVRLLSRRPEIVVGTPGRLWELMHQQGHEHFVDLGRLGFFVLDEADRMVEKGHFKELANIIDTLPMPPRIKRPPGAAKATPETLKILKKRAPGTKEEAGGKKGGKGQKGGNAIAVDGDVVEDANPGHAEIILRPSQMLDRQTFVFSATLTVPDNVRKKLKRRHSQAHIPDDLKGGDKKRLAAATGGPAAGTLGQLMEAVPFYGRVKLVDLTDQSQTVAKRVIESALECTEVRLTRTLRL